MSTSLGGTRALVTGATSGLGLAMARALAGAGAAVAVTGRDAARAGQVSAALPGATGIALDVRDERSVAEGLRPIDPAVMGPPIVWLASPAADGVHDERIVATEFADRPGA